MPAFRSQRRSELSHQLPPEATVSNPGGTSVTWSITFPTYDHPHSYYVAAWAQDADGLQDTTHAQLARFCVKDVGDNTCS